ncbi:hypothetical protein IEQ34_007498 [Dendrobium chrysotoxum]|uniref:Glycosyltransferase N-terminal domain-containing protein n=1 Tax=Dendrobium chrysotoxum TaxID=161865 RepID=A0AAV7H1F6_DENCH|nr:hypothetical protein IEQ34_007498 [Dendrobium chrysotoxum]
MGAATGRVGPSSHRQVHEPLRVELVHGGDELRGSCDGVAYAFGPTDQHEAASGGVEGWLGGQRLGSLAGGGGYRTGGGGGEDGDGRGGREADAGESEEDQRSAPKASYSTRQRNVERRRSNRSDSSLPSPEPPQPTPPLLPPSLHQLWLSRPLCLLSLPQPPSDAPPPRLAPLLPLLHPLPRPPPSPIPSPPPNPHSPTTFPTHLQPLFDATDLIRSPLSSLLLSLSASSRRLVVVHNHLMSFAGLEAAAIPNAESYKFYSPYAAFLCEAEQLRMQGTDLEELFSPEFRLFTARRRKHKFKSSGLIINTCREVERNFLEILATREAYSCVPVSAVGPLNPAPVNITGTEFSP